MATDYSLTSMLGARAFQSDAQACGIGLQVKWKDCLAPPISWLFESICTQYKRDGKYKEIIERLRKDICVEVFYDKFSVVHTKWGVIFDSTCVTGITVLLVEDNYKYLSILECDPIILTEVKEYV